MSALREQDIWLYQEIDTMPDDCKSLFMSVEMCSRKNAK